MTDADDQLDHVLRQTVFIGGANRPFAELTVADVRSRADELKAVTGFGPTARVAPVARAWRELLIELERAGVENVGGLAPARVLELAPKLWVVPPGGTLL